MAEKKIRRRRVPIDIRAATREWLQFDDAASAFNKKRDEAKKLLMEILELEGERDEKGSLWIRFDDDPVEGRITGLQRQRRAPTVLDAEAAEKYLRERDLWDRCTTTITVLDEEKLMGLNFTEVIPDEDLKKLYTVKETWAFVPQRARA